MPAAVRTLLGAFGIDAMAQVTTALADQEGGAMLALVDELERNGGSPQHFSRELSRYLRNVLVTKISGGGFPPDRGQPVGTRGTGAHRRRVHRRGSDPLSAACRWIFFAICSFLCSRGFISKSGC